MSFERYPMYKRSGVEWLGDVPAHWREKRLRFVAEFNPSKSELDAVDRQTAVSFLPMEAIGDDGALILGHVRTIGELESGYTYFRDGDVVLAKITPCYENGKGALLDGLVNGVGFGTTELIVARPIPTEIISSYLHYLFISPEFRRLGESHMFGAGGQKRVPDAFVRNFATAFPPLAEQRRIVAFLDMETAKIRGLVGEQERLIDLLREKRQASISHAVMKGVNPAAAMRSSNIKWLGDIPAHWNVQRLKYVTPQVTVGIVVEPSKYYVPDGVPALRSLNVAAGRLKMENLVFISTESNELHSKSKLRAGDLVVVRSGQPGTTAVIPAELDGCNCIDLIIIRKPLVGNEWFLSWYLSSDAAIGQFAVGSGGAIQQHFNVGTAVDLFVPIPPAREQNAIVDFVSAEAAKFDALTSEALRAINLLLERRAALISAAVTGRIDVRGLAKSETA
jgi:type I restriction enzyme S subunit